MSIDAVDPLSFDDANIDHTSGAIYFEWQPTVAASEVSGDLELLSLNAGADLAYYDGTNSQVESADGTNTGVKSLTIVKDTTYEVGVIWDATAGNMRVNVDGTWGTEVSFDGTYTVGTVLELFNDFGYVNKMRTLKGYSGSYSALQSQIESLMP